jgi:hypothetical protein
VLAAAENFLSSPKRTSTAKTVVYSIYGAAEAAALQSTRTGEHSRTALLIFVQILAGHVVLGNFMGVNFFSFGVAGMFNACDGLSLEGVPLFQQFVNAFGIRLFGIG